MPSKIPMFCRTISGKRCLTTLVTPGQGIVSQETIQSYKPFLNNAKVKEFLTTTDEITKSKISSIFTDTAGVAQPEIDTQRTSIQQPLILLTNFIQKQILLHNYGVDLYGNNLKSHISFTLGHSLGEISNLALQGCISFENAIKLVHTRGKLMESCVAAATDDDKTYKMFVLMIDKKKFEESIKAIESQRGLISISNINSDDQVVISGTAKNCEIAIKSVANLVRIRKQIDLKVAIPFHTDILSPIIPQLRTIFEETTAESSNKLAIPAIANLDGAGVLTREDYVEKILNVTSKTVNFKKCIDHLIELAVQRDENELTFINYSSVTNNLIDRYLKSQKVKFKSYKLDSDDGIKAFITDFRSH